MFILRSRGGYVIEIRDCTLCSSSLAQSYSTKKVLCYSFVIHGLDVDPSHFLLLIESLDTSFD